MPRTTSQKHFDRHHLLRELWLFVPSIYSTLLPTQQWEMHRLYAPDRFLEDEEIVDHVKKVAEIEPSLPNRVGKHWKRISQLYDWASKSANGPEDWDGIHRALVRARVMGQVSLGEVPQRSRHKAGYVIRVAPVVNPEPNYDKLAYALLEQVKLIREQKDRIDNGHDV